MDMNYTDLINMRSQLDLILDTNPIYAGELSDQLIGYNISLSRNDGIVRNCIIGPDNTNWDDFINRILSYANKVIDTQEVRFKTHDFSDKSDWDGRTHGDQVAYLAGGYLKHPIDGSWLNSTGAAMIGSYANPEDPHYKDFTYLFGSLEQKITSKYDDVNYQWLDASGSRISYLDINDYPCQWKADNNDVVVCYSGTDWIRLDNSSVVTSSLWRILPYPSHKIQINKAILQVDTMTEFSGTINYLVYMNLDANKAGPDYPAGNYPVKDWSYKSLADFQAGTDTTPYVEPMTREGHSGPIMTMTYDYKSSTKPQVIDDLLGMHLDIFIDNHEPVTNTLGAHATFICLSKQSF